MYVLKNLTFDAKKSIFKWENIELDPEEVLCSDSNSFSNCFCRKIHIKTNAICSNFQKTTCGIIYDANIDETNQKLQDKLLFVELIPSTEFTYQTAIEQIYKDSINDKVKPIVVLGLLAKIGNKIYQINNILIKSCGCVLVSNSRSKTAYLSLNIPISQEENKDFGTGYYRNKIIEYCVHYKLILFGVHLDFWMNARKTTSKLYQEKKQHFVAVDFRCNNIPYNSIKHNKNF